MLNSLSAEELEFVKAIEKYKKEKSQNFLSWTEVLAIVKDLGYRKSEQARKKRAASKAKKEAKNEAKSEAKSETKKEATAETNADTKVEANAGASE